MNPLIQILDAGSIEDFEELIDVFADVFDMEHFSKPDRAHLRHLLGRDNFLAVIARHDGRVIGGLTVYLLEQYYAEKSLAYIYDLAVLREYQRKGVGKQLMNFTNEYCRSHGVEEVFVQADKVDDYAIDFYRLTNPTTEEAVVHFTYKL